MYKITSIFFIALSTIISHQALGSSSVSPGKNVTVKFNSIDNDIALTYMIKGAPIIILKRNKNEIAQLREIHVDDNAVPNCPKCDRKLRSILADVFVVSGYNPISGCKLTYVSSNADDWIGHPIYRRGGFVDKCSGAEYDLSGRKINSVTALPDELEIPLYSVRKGAILLTP